MLGMTGNGSIPMDDTLTSPVGNQMLGKLPTDNLAPTFADTSKAAPFAASKQHVLPQNHVSSLEGVQNGTGLEEAIHTADDTIAIDTLTAASKSSQDSNSKHDHHQSLLSLSSKPNGAHNRPSQSSSDSTGRLGTRRSVDHQCDCYESVLQTLGDFDRSRPKQLEFSIDIVLGLEESAQLQADQVLHCSTCSCARPDLFLLLALAINNTVGILESVSTFTITPYTSSSMIQIPSPRRSSYSTYNNSSNSSIYNRTPNDSLLDLMDSRPLLAGGFEILAEEKVDFFKQFLCRRLRQLSSTLQQLQQCTSRVPQSLISQSGLNLLSETHRRLQLVLGKLELWHS